MPTLDSLEIHDFQSIKKVKVDFSPKPSGGSVTTVVGPSSTGKSAMLRALKTLLRNTSSAPVRIQEGAAKATVTGDFNGTPVRVERGKSLSTYYIGTEKYSKAGTTVPQAVQDVLKLDDSAVEIHYADQFSKPYLLDETGTTVSSIIGKLTHANTLRLAVKEGNRRSLEATRLLKTRTTDLETVREQITHYEWVDKSVAEVAEANKLLSDYRNLLRKVSSAQAVVSAHAENAQKVTEASQRAKDLPDVSSEVEKAQPLLERCVSVYSLLSMIEDKKYFATKLLKEKPATFDKEEIDAVESLYNKIEKTQQLISKIRGDIETCQDLQKIITRLKESAQDVQTVFDGALRSAGTCPLCGNQTTSSESGHSS